jgi:hypothetical protein
MISPSWQTIGRIIALAVIALEPPEELERYGHAQRPV